MKRCKCEHWQTCPTCYPQGFDEHGARKPVEIPSSREELQREITALREQVEKLTKERDEYKHEAHCCNIEYGDVHDSYTQVSEELAALAEQVEKLTKERDASISDVDTIAQHNIELQQQLATLAEQNEKMLDALNKIHDTTAPYDDGVKFGYVKELALSCLQLPNLTTPALNKYRAEGMRMAADFAVVVRDDWVHVDDNHKAYAADYLVSSIRARADELEKINAAPFA